MSDILIKGMKMPVTCCHCPLMGYAPEIEWNDGGKETQGAYICVMTHELIDNTKREEHCPLVPVPPHGRLIDADALKLSHCKECTLYPDKCLEKTGEGCDWGSIYHIEHCAPTIIPAEEGE